MSRPAAGAVHRVLGIHLGDGRALLGIGLAAFWLNAGAVLAWSALMGRFVSQLGGERMPLVYISVNLAAVALLLGQARSRPAPRRGALAPLLAAASGGLVLMGLAPAQGPPSLVFGCFLGSWLYLMLGELEFWKWLGQALPLRLGRRLAPGVGAMGTAGRVAGAALAIDPLGLGSVASLLLLAAGLNGLALPALWWAGRQLADHPEGGGAPEPPAARPGLADSAAYLRRSPLLLRIAALAAVVGFFKGTAHYPLTVLARTTFATEEATAAFFGALGAGVNMAAVLLQLVGTGRLLRRLPLRISLGAFPAAMGLVALVAIPFPVFPLAAALRFLQRGATRALFVPACVVLFGPVPARHFGAARNLAYGVAGACGFLVAGIGLWLAAGRAPLAVVYAAVAVAGGLALLACRGLDAAYLGALVEASAEDRSAEGEGTPMAGVSGELAGALLGSHEPELVALVERVAAGGAGGDLTAPLRQALTTSGAPLRRRALECLVAQTWRGPELASLASGLLLDGDPDMVRAAARCLARTRDSTLAGTVVEALRALPPESSPVVPIRLAGALVALGSRASDLRAGLARLRRGLAAPDPTTRAAAVEELGRLGSASFAPALAEALEDGCPEVVAEAGLALARTRAGAAVDLLMARRDREPEGPLRQELTRALTRLHSGTLNQVAALLDGFDGAERRHLAGALRGLAHGGRLALLPRVLAVEDPDQRRALVEALRHENDPGFLAALEACLDAEGERGGRLARLVPLLELAAARGWDIDHPVARLGAELAGSSHRREARGWIREELAGAAALEGSGLRSRLRLVCLLLGALRRTPGAFVRALELVEAGSPQAPTALELLETGPREIAQKEALVQAAERLGPARAGAPGAGPAGSGAAGSAG